MLKPKSYLAPSDTLEIQMLVAVISRAGCTASWAEPARTPRVAGERNDPWTVGCV